MVLKDPRFKRESASWIFLLFSLDIFRYACLSVPNCKLLENILGTFCIAQIWYDLSILRMFTVVKCRGYTNFYLSKIYEGHFQLTYNLVNLRYYIQRLDLQSKKKSRV